MCTVQDLCSVLEEYMYILSLVLRPTPDLSMLHVERSGVGLGTRLIHLHDNTILHVLL